MTPDTLSATLFLIASLVLAGVCQVLWLRSDASARFTQRVDLGRTLRGRPLFGENKTVRGFMVMVPATGASFVLVSQLAELLGWCEGLWSLSPLGYAGLGLAAGFGFMAGELPNSMLKRQLDVAPGQAPADRRLALLCLALDRTDSLLGSLFAIWLCVPLPWTVWLACLLIGPGIHATFSFALYKLGVKKRAG